MNKAISKALVEIVFAMAQMVIYQSNIFGTIDCLALKEKCNKLADLLEKETMV